MDFLSKLLSHDKVTCKIFKRCIQLNPLHSCRCDRFLKSGGQYVSLVYKPFYIKVNFCFTKYLLPCCKLVIDPTLNANWKHSIEID